MTCSIIRIAIAALADAADDLDHALDLGRIEAGEHLVEQQQARAGAERARELEPLLAGGGELPGRHVEPIREPDQLGDLAHDLAGARERQVLAAEAGADRAIVEHAQAGERLHDLDARARGRGARCGKAARR